MLRTAILISLVTLGGCAVTAETAFYAPLVDTRTQTSRRDGFAGDGAIARIEIKASRRYTKRVSASCSYMHVSNTHSRLSEEDWIDAVGCGAQVTLFGGKNL